MDRHRLLRKKKRAKEENNLEEVAAACKQLGDIYTCAGKYEDALEEYKEEEKIWKSVGNQMQMGVANRMIGEVYSHMGEFDKALGHQKIHLDAAESENNLLEKQRALATIGRTYFCLSESLAAISSNEEDVLKAVADAKKAYRRSLEICERLTGIRKEEQAEMRARLLLNIGLVLERQSETEKAVELMKKAVSLCKQHNLVDDLYRCYVALATVFHRCNEPSRALSLLGQATEVATRLPNKAQLTIEVLNCKAEVLLGLADFRAARQVLHKAYKLLPSDPSQQQDIERNLRLTVALCRCEERLLATPESDHETLKQLYEQLGDGCVTAKNLNKALEYYQCMLASAEAAGYSGSQLAPAFVSLARTYQDAGQYDKAVEYFQKELEVWRDSPLEACKTQLNIAEVLLLRDADYVELEDVLVEARRLAVLAGSNHLETRALEALLSVQKARGFKNLAADTEKLLQDRPLDESEEDHSGDEEEATPDVGSTICLETLTDESASDDEEFDRLNSTRKRSRKLRIRKNEKGETQLHTACISGNVALARQLLQQGHPVNVRDYCGWTPLHEACNHGHKEVVELLLTHGASINDRGGVNCGGVTPLHDAACCGHLGVMEVLLDHGASAVVRTDQGETVLDCLLQWKERVTELEPSEEAYTEEMVARLRATLEKAGHQPTAASSDHSTQPAVTSEKVSGSTLELVHRRRKRVHSESDSEVVPPFVPRESFSDTSDQEDVAAREEYISAIQSIRTRHVEQNHVQMLEDRTLLEDRVAFLSEKEVGDHWLEDDMAMQRSFKRRKTKLSDYVERSQKPCPSNELGTPPEERPLTPVVADVNPVCSNLLPQTPVTPHPKENSEPVQWSRHSAKVRVEDLLFLVPIGDSPNITVGWLAQEAAQRYYKEKGVKPNFNLVTKDGALLSNEDPISVIFGLDEVSSKVVSWNIVPITQRYLDALPSKNSDVDAHLLKRLEESESTMRLVLQDVILEPVQLGHLLQALRKHSTLKELWLGGNILGEEAAQFLASALPTLSSLQVLSLPCCSLTHRSLSLISSSAVLPALLSLDLSHNPLGGRCLKPLGDLLSRLNSLRSLKLEACGLTGVPHGLSLGSIQNLSVSHNPLGRALAGWLHTLSLNCVVSLEVANCSEAAVLVSQWLEGQQATCLTTLDLSACTVGDVELWQLLQVLESAPLLESLTLRCNELSSISLRRIFQHRPPLSHVDLRGCCSILRNFQNCFPTRQGLTDNLESLLLTETGTVSKLLEDMWRKKWGNKATVRKGVPDELHLQVCRLKSAGSSNRLPTFS